MASCNESPMRPHACLSQSCTTAPWLLHSMHGVLPWPAQALHSTEAFSSAELAISSFWSHPGAHASRLFRMLAFNHSFLLPSQVLTMHTKVSPAVRRLSVTWKCRQPSVLSMAVHFDPVAGWMWCLNSHAQGAQAAQACSRTSRLENMACMRFSPTSRAAMTGLRWWKPPRPSRAVPPQAWQMSCPAPAHRGHSSRWSARLWWTTFLPDVLVPQEDALRCIRPATTLIVLCSIAYATAQTHPLPSAVCSLLDGLCLWAHYQGHCTAHCATQPCWRAGSVMQEGCERSHVHSADTVAGVKAVSDWTCPFSASTQCQHRVYHYLSMHYLGDQVTGLPSCEDPPLDDA